MENTVLIIDDEELNLKLVRRLLQLKDCKVLEAKTAEIGIEQARAHKPSLILMDICLPGMDGLAATLVLKNDPATRGIPVIALSAYAMEADKVEAAEAGCADYISKPFELQTFRAVLDRHLRESC